MPTLPGPDHFDAYLHGLLAPAETAAVEAHAADPAWAAALAAARRRRAALIAAMPAAEASEALVHATVDRVAGYDAARRRRKRRMLAIMFGPLAAAAAVLVAFQLHFNRVEASPANLELLGQSRLLAGSPASLRVRLSDGRTRDPLANVPVEVALRGPDGQFFELASFTTDAAGTGRPSFRVPGWADGDYQLRVTASAADGAEVLTETVRVLRSRKVMLSADKPVYQPGQTIRLRGLALGKPDLRPVADKPAVFTVTDPKGNVVFKHAATTSQFGITAADCPLASEVIEGPYTIRCTVGDTDSSLTVEVQKYVLPRFKIDVALDRAYYAPGQKVEAKVQAAYFFGKPVAGGALDVEVRANEPNGVVLAKFGKPTDADGKAEFDFLLPDTLSGRPQDGGDAKFLLTITARDTAGQRQARTVSRPVTAEPLRVELIPENGALVPGLENRIYLYAGTPDGQPARIRGTVTVEGGAEPLPFTTNDLGVATVRVTPGSGLTNVTVRGDRPDGRPFQRSLTLSSGGFSGDFLFRTDQATATAGDTLTVSIVGGGTEPVFLDVIKDGQTVRTDTVELTQGQGAVALDLPPELAGTVELCAYRFTPDGLVQRKLRTLYVRPARQLQLRATLDKPEYRPGETAKLSFALTDDQGKPTPGALSLAAVDEAVFSVLESMPGMEKTFYLLEQELLQPVYTIYPWSPDGPQDPQRTEFEQALFSRTVRNVAPQAGPMREVQRVIESGSGPMTITELVTTAGIGGGPHSLARDTYGDKVQQALARKSFGLERVVAGWKSLALVAALALYVALWLTWGEYLIGRVVLGTLTGLAVLVAVGVWSSTKVREAAFTAVGLEMLKSDMAMMPADRVTTTTATGEAPGMDAGDAGAPVRVREKFPETLLWRPELITDDQGRAALDLELADSITTWRLSGSAVTSDGRLGALQSAVKVFQPFFVDLNLPVALTRGDEVSVPVVVSNFVARPQTVTLTLADADWCERTGDAVQTVELKPNEVRSVSYRLRVKRAGNHTLQVEARGEGVADAVKRAIEVVPDGRRVEQVVNGTLAEPAAVNFDLPADAIDGSARLLVKLYPSSFSQLVEGLDGIFRMPSGCFEQTSSSTYPNVLALDYLKRTGKSSPQVEAKARQYVHLGYQRLLTFEVPGGGFDWYGRAPANEALTAYGLMEFTDMARVHDVDPNLIQRTRNWLIRRRQRDGTWADTGRFAVGDGDPRLRATAYIALAVFQDPAADIDPAPTLAYLTSHKPETIADPNLLALVTNALLAIDAKHAAVPAFLARLEVLKRTSPDAKQAWWELGAGGRTPFYGAGISASVETTALAALAGLKAGDRPATVRQALAWLVANKDPNGTWHSTQATVLALKALLAGTGKPLGGDGERRFEVALDGKPVESVAIPTDQAEVMKQLDLTAALTPGAHRLTVTETTPSAAGFQVAYRYHVPGAAPAPAAEPLTIALSFDREQLAVGEVLTATALVTNRTPQVAPMVMLDLPIPAGFAVDADSFTRLVRAGTISRFETTPRQVIVYLRELRPASPLTVTYTLRPTMPVTLSVPAARVYEYYAPERQGRSEPRAVTVRGR